MKRKVKLFSLLLGVIVLVSCSKEEDDRSSLLMKGLELYSWESKGTWNFVVTGGTNATKTYEMIVNSDNILKGVSELKEYLKTLPSGESIFWISEDWLRSCWSTDYGNLKLPSGDLVKEIQKYGATIGLKITVS